MFRSEGQDRSDRLNRIVAGYLAFIGGFVNAMGLVLVSTLTSHVTGNVARAAVDGVRFGSGRALVPALLVLAFFGGAFAASVLLENRRLRTSARYGVALTIEAAVLVVFLVSSHAWLLSVAMGLQNSLVTRLSGAIVRTTHLTGVVTDLGIEAARWWQWLWHRGTERPPAAKVALLATIAGAFSAGAVIGAATTAAYGEMSLGLPILALAAAAAYALVSDR